MSEQAAVPDEVAVQPALPDFELPEMEGVRPVGVVTSLNGSGERIQRPIHYGERGVLVVEYELEEVGLKKTGQGPKRAQRLKVLDLYELPGKPGAKLLRSLRTAYRMADDQRHGRRRLDLSNTDDHVGMEVAADGSGVVMTPGERGSLSGLGLPDVDAFVLVFEGGQRALWPDEFEDGAAALPSERPGAGDQLVPPGAKAERTVWEVLDVDTGEAIEEWDEEREQARLVEAERLAAEQEARADVEALAELERGRGRCGAIFPGGVCALQAGHEDKGVVEHSAAAGGPGDTSNVVEGSFGTPWPDYDDCTVSDVEAALEEETDRDKVFAVAAYEERTGARKGVLKACAKRAAELEAEPS
jgi:hypothetical protein